MDSSSGVFRILDFSSAYGYDIPTTYERQRYISCRRCTPQKGCVGGIFVHKGIKFANILCESAKLVDIPLIYVIPIINNVLNFADEFIIVGENRLRLGN